MIIRDPEDSFILVCEEPFFQSVLVLKPVTFCSIIFSLIKNEEVASSAPAAYISFLAGPSCEKSAGYLGPEDLSSALQTAPTNDIVRTGFYPLPLVSVQKLTFLSGVH